MKNFLIMLSLAGMALITSTLYPAEQQQQYAPLHHHPRTTIASPIAVRHFAALQPAAYSAATAPAAPTVRHNTGRTTLGSPTAITPVKRSDFLKEQELKKLVEKLKMANGSKLNEQHNRQRVLKRQRFHLLQLPTLDAKIAWITEEIAYLSLSGGAKGFHLPTDLISDTPAYILAARQRPSASPELTTISESEETPRSAATAPAAPLSAEDLLVAMYKHAGILLAELAQGNPSGALTHEQNQTLYSMSGQPFQDLVAWLEQEVAALPVPARQPKPLSALTARPLDLSELVKALVLDSPTATIPVERSLPSNF